MGIGKERKGLGFPVISLSRCLVVSEEANKGEEEHHARMGGTLGRPDIFLRTSDQPSKAELELATSLDGDLSPLDGGAP